MTNNPSSYYLELYVEDLYFAHHNQELPINEQQWENYIDTWFNSLTLNFDNQKNYEMSLLFTDDEEIQRLNSQFRHQDKPTDVLSFASLETDFPDFEEIDSIPLGDIIISVETATKQAQSQNHSLELELIWLASHGFLHLLGWDHPDDDSLMEMLNVQQQLLKAIAISPPKF